MSVYYMKRYRQNFQRLVLLSKYTLVHLLVAGKHEIRPNFNIEERTCGIIPVGTEYIIYRNSSIDDV